MREHLSLDECPCGGRNLDKLLQPAILAALARGPLHGYRILQQLGDMPAFGGHKPDPAGVYRLLKTMEDRGVLSAKWELDSGPARRQLELTAEGRRCMVKWAKTLQGYRNALDLLLGDLESAAGICTPTCACVRRRKPAAGKA